MATWDDNNEENKDTVVHDEKREKILVPVPRYKNAQEESTSDDPARDEVPSIPRRWYIY